MSANENRQGTSGQAEIWPGDVYGRLRGHRLIFALAWGIAVLIYSPFNSDWEA
jgi:hypothetical protein